MLVVVLVCRAAEPDSTKRLPVQLQSAELEVSLAAVSRQFGIQLIYDPKPLHGLVTRRVIGTYTALEALDRLLAQTGLSAHEQRPGAFLVTVVPPQPSPASRPIPSGALQSPETRLEELVVTGSHIRGGVPTGATLISYDQEELGRLGIDSADSLGRQLIPNFSGADAHSTVNTNGNVGSLQQGATANVFGGSGFDLLGLGPGSTLTLLNGHRIAPGGLDGSLVDVSLIPLSALERVDILIDGASAVYGSDAVAGVVNLATRRHFDGIESTLRYGRATQGGAGRYTASQLAGGHWTGGNGFVDYEYDDQQGLDASERTWLAPQNGPYSLLPSNRRNTIFVSVDQAWHDTDFSATALYSTRQFQTAGIVLESSHSAPLSDNATGRASLGWAAVSAGHELPANWHADLTGLYSGMRQRRDGTEYPNGFGMSSFSSLLVADSDLEALELSASGDVMPLPAGMIRLSLGGDFQAESFKTSVLSFPSLPAVSRSRTDGGLYGEERIPLVGGELTYPAIHRLEVTLAVRFDSYSNFGNTTNPEWGWAWEPIEGLTLRGTKGASFKAPQLAQLSAPVTSYTSSLPSAVTGGKPTDALIISGGNPTLEAQKSHFLTVGLDWQPPASPTAKVSVTYFRVSYDNRIQSQNVENRPLEQQPQLTALTAADPVTSFVQGYFSDPGFLQDGAGLGPAGVTAFVDNRLENVATTKEQGLLLSSHLWRDSNWGRFSANLEAQYLLAARTQTAGYQFAPFLNVAGTIGEPPKARAQAIISWDWRMISANMTASHSGAYQNALFSPAQRIGSWTTEDLNISIGLPTSLGWMPHGSVALMVRNLADHKPPSIYIPTSDVAIGRAPVSFDGSNSSPIGRYIALQVRAAW